MTTIKPGYKTTEFYAVLATNVGIMSGALAGTLPAEWAAIASSISVSAYAIARAIAKFKKLPAPDA